MADARRERTSSRFSAGFREDGAGVARARIAAFMIIRMIFAPIATIRAPRTTNLPGAIAPFRRWKRSMPSILRR